MSALRPRSLQSIVSYTDCKSLIDNPIIVHCTDVHLRLTFTKPVMLCLAQACSRADAQTERLMCQTERDMQNHKHKGTHVFDIAQRVTHVRLFLDVSTERRLRDILRVFICARSLKLARDYQIEYRHKTWEKRERYSLKSSHVDACR